MAEDPWPVIHAERTALSEDLAGLAADRWNTPSLCAPWTVKEVLAHMTATATATPRRFLVRLAKAGFRFDRMTERALAERSALPAEQLVADFRAHAQDRTSPPGPVDSWLGETLVHGEDIRRPLGIAHAYPIPALVRIADFYRRSNLLIGAKRRIADLRLVGTDADWSTGAGPEVSGPMLSLVLAMTGRPAALADLTGDGVPMLASRMPAR
jgi:uncharacterized protein (TIGR03083 family)